MLCTLNSSSNFDLERSRPQYIEQWKKLRSNIFLIACNQDVEYTITKMNSIHEKLNEVGTKSHFFVIDSELGHGAFLSDQQAIEPIFKLMRSKALYPT
jgi:homoserine acetyltransferase